MSIQDQLFSAKASIAEKVSVLNNAKLLASNIPGINQLQNSSKGAALDIVPKFTPNDFGSGLEGDLQAASTTITPKEAKAEQQQFQGTLVYPAEMKYYTKFVFKAYERANVLIDAHDLPQCIIVLPIPANLQESFSVAYEVPALGPMPGAFSDAMRSLIEAPSAGEALKNMSGSQYFDTLKSAIGQAGYLGLKGALTGVVEALSKDAGRSVGASISRVTGLVPNPHLAAIFNSVDLRRHSFAYLFAPNNQKELTTLKLITKTLKKRMLPTLAGSVGMLYSFPDTVDISFGPDPNLPYTIKRCVLTNLDINYSPSNTPAFFKTGDTVAVSIRMDFMEMEQYTRKDVGRVLSDYNPETLENVG